MPVEEQKTPATEQPATGPVPNAPDLNIVDLRNAIHIIDVAVARRAFGGWEEINNVKAVRDRFHAFLSAVAPDEIQKLDESTKTAQNNPASQDAVVETPKEVKVPKKGKK